MGNSATIARAAGSYPHARGWTLLELMIVVVVVSVLLLLAVPAYREFVQRGQRMEAKQALLRLAANQEKYFIQNNTYTTNLDALGFAGNMSETGLYELKIEIADDLGFRATASPAMSSGLAADEECRQFTVDESGRRMAVPDTHGRCW